MMIRYLQTQDPMVVWTLHIVAGYLMGSIMFCRWIPKLVLHKDVCALSDDHNPGAANVFQHCGVPAGLLCLFFDLSKGFLPVYLAAHTVGIEPMQFAAVMMAPVLGHATAPFDHFSGGKCIDTVGMGVSDGAQLQIWQETAGEDQLWTIEEVKDRAKRAVKKAEPAVEAAPAAEPVKTETAPVVEEKAAEPVAAPAVEEKPEVKEEAKTEEKPAEAEGKAEPAAEAPKAEEKPAAPAAKAPAKKPASKKTSRAARKAASAKKAPAKKK